ncbi:MAG: two-component system response regulator [Cellvibrionaceae bacterium]|nr:two-component system response regulator [Cellvibrionaceae bacterium]
MTIRATLLIVDDVKENIDLLKECLRHDYNIIAATSGEKALHISKLRQPDLVLLDIMMPEMDGYETCRRLKSYPESRDTPVIFVSANADVSSETKGLAVGAVDYLYKPVHPEIVRRRVSLHLQQLNRQRGLRQKIKEKDCQVEEARQQIISKLCQAAEFRDNETALHITRMSYYSQILAQGLGMSEETSQLVLQASPMHDVGKIGIPDSILLKPGKLTTEVFEVMKKHPEIGAKILGSDNYPLFNMARDIALHHHEKWDGTGYPYGLSGLDIPVSARIVAVADVFDALTSSRPYKKAWSIEDAVSHMKNQKGKHFDPQIIEVFIKVLPEILRLRAQYLDEIDTSIAQTD